MKKLYILFILSVLASCVHYDAEEYKGYTLPRITGYNTGVTNDWLYINLRTGTMYNATAPNQEINEGEQYNRTDWDLAFCGYRLRTNSGTSGCGKGGSADLGYQGYDKWTSTKQVENLTFATDNDSTIFITMSKNDWNKYLLAHNMSLENNPWFDPNTGPVQVLSSANPVLAEALKFTSPPPVYTPSLHTYVIRTADGKQYYKFEIVSWYNANSEIGDTGGRISYYLDKLN